LCAMTGIILPPLNRPADVRTSERVPLGVEYLFILLKLSQEGRGNRLKASARGITRII